MSSARRAVSLAQGIAIGAVGMAFAVWRLAEWLWDATVRNETR